MLIGLRFLLAPIALAVSVGFASAQVDRLPPELRTVADAYLTELESRPKPDDVAVQSLLSEVAEAEKDGRTGAAIAAYEQLVMIEPESYRAWLQLAASWRRAAPTSDNAIAAAVLARESTQRDFEQFEALLMVTGLLRDRLDSAQSAFEQARLRILTIEETSRVWEVPLNSGALADGASDLSPLYQDFIAARQEAFSESVAAAEQVSKIVAQLDEVYKLVFTVVRDEAAWERVDKELKANLFEVALDESDSDRSPPYDIVTETPDDHSRACIRFSLPVSRNVDAVKQALTLKDLESGKSYHPGSVEITDDRICILALEPEHEYRLTIHGSLSSQTGSRLEQTITDIDLSVPPRAPLVGFRGSAFILPRHGNGEVPVYTVNRASVPLHLLRITNRNLHRHVALGHIGGRLPTAEYRDIRQQFSDPIWDGVIAVADQPNKLVTSHVPILRILEERSSWLENDPVLDDGRDLPHVSPMDAPGANIRGTYIADLVSFQAGGPADSGPGLYALVTEGLDTAPGDVDEEETNDDPEAERLACEAFCGENYVVQWMVRTDIGLAFYESKDRLHVVARSLASGKAIVNAKIELVSANNRVLKHGTTNGDGVASFPRRLTLGTRGNRLAVVMAETGDDFSFIDFGRDRLDLSRLGVSGRKDPGERDLFIYTDRGMYRPEETIRMTVLVRNSSGLMPEVMTPMRVRLMAGESLLDTATIERTDWKLGGTNLELRIPKTVRLGGGEVQILDAGDDEVIATAPIQIDHFRPDRARIDFLSDKDWSAVTDSQGRLVVRGQVAADYLFGDARIVGQAAAANLRSEVEVKLEAADTPVSGCYDGYRFGPLGNAPSRIVLDRLDLVTDDNGRLDFASTPRALASSDHPLKADVTVTVFDNAGPVASRTNQVGVTQDRDWIGVAEEPTIRPAASDGSFRLSFDLIGLNGRNQPLDPRRLSFKLFTERDIFVWEQRNGVWTSASDVARSEITGDWPDQMKSLTLAAGSSRNGDCLLSTGAIDLELPLGRYLLEVTEELTGRVTATRFVTGSTSASIRDPEPNLLDVATDKSHYELTDTATLRVYAPFEGEVMVAIADDDVLRWATGSTTDRIASIDVPIDPEWAGKGLYALATVYRRQTDGTMERGPARAIGATYFQVDGGESRFDLAINAPTLTKPETVTRVDVCVTDGATCRTDFSDAGYVSLYTVDEGLISLTAHPVADPYGQFFGQRQLPIAMMDNYGRILLQETTNGEGGDRPSRLALSNYTSDKIVSELAGPVPLIEGVATFEVPPLKIDGSMRLVAVGWTATGLAADAETLPVADTIVPRLDAPRFLTPGDTPVMPLLVSNRELASGAYRFSIKTSPGLSITGIADSDGGSIIDETGSGFALDLARGATRIAFVSFAVAGEIQEADAEVTVSVQGRDIVRKTLIPIRPIAPPTVETVVAQLGPGQSVSLGEFVREKIAGRYGGDGIKVQTRLSARGPIAIASPGGGSREAPPPTLERLVWTGMALAGQPQTAESRVGHQEQVDEIVRTVQSLQAHNGSFLPYRPIGDFVAEESEEPSRLIQSATIADSLMFRSALALDFLNLVSGRYGWQPSTGLIPVSIPVEKRAVAFLAGKLEQRPFRCEPAYLYAALVLVPHQRVTAGNVTDYQNRCGDDSTPLTRALLAAFLSEYGHADVAEDLLVDYDLAALSSEPSSAKIAMTLSFLVQANANQKLLQAVYEELVALGLPQEFGVRDQSWLSRSALAAGKTGVSDELVVEVTPEGFFESVSEDDDGVALSPVVDFATLETAEHSLSNRGTKPLALAVTVEGVRTGEPDLGPSADWITKRFFNEAGKEIDLADTQIAIGDRLLVVVEASLLGSDPTGDGIEGMSDTSRAVIVADLLPSAFEVITPNAFENEIGVMPAGLPRSVRPVGTLRSVDAGDDRVLSVVLPKPGESDSAGLEEAEDPAVVSDPVDLRVAYYVRVVSAGDFIAPGTFIEPLSRTTETIRTAPFSIKVARTRQ